MIDKVKTALRLNTCVYDEEIADLIAAAYDDIGIAGIPLAQVRRDPLIVRAVITYCRANFGSPGNYDRLKASFDEQKAQLQSSSKYGLR